jgi:hypothetical protein
MVDEKLTVLIYLKTDVGSTENGGRYKWYEPYPIYTKLAFIAMCHQGVDTEPISGHSSTQSHFIVKED